MLMGVRHLWLVDCWDTAQQPPPPQPWTRLNWFRGWGSELSKWGPFLTKPTAVSSVKEAKIFILLSAVNCTVAAKRFPSNKYTDQHGPLLGCMLIRLLSRAFTSMLLKVYSLPWWPLISSSQPGLLHLQDQLLIFCQKEKAHHNYAAIWNSITLLLQLK